MKAKKNCIFLVLMGRFAVRNSLESGFLKALSNASDRLIVCLTDNQKDEQQIKSLKNVQWRDVNFPLGPKKIFQRNWIALLKRTLYCILHLIFFRKFNHANVSYRHGEINQLKSHQVRKKHGKQLRKNYAKVHSFVDPRLGFPFPKSKFLYKFATKMLYMSWGIHDRVLAFFTVMKPVLVVINHIQNPFIRDYVSAARKFRLPMIGIVASWDQPTLRGHIPPFFSKYIVQNHFMRQCLAEYHNIEYHNVLVAGWPQYDFFLQNKNFENREKFIKKIGLNPSKKMIFFSANAKRLGRHEPSIADFIMKHFVNVKFALATMAIRSHPHEPERIAFFPKEIPGKLVRIKGNYTDLKFLANLTRHSSVCISTAGTAGIEAVALGTIAIYLDFDGSVELLPDESIRQHNLVEHVQATKQPGGPIFVSSYDELNKVLSEILHEKYSVPNKKNFFDLLINPLDGLAARRMVNFILSEAIVKSS